MRHLRILAAAALLTASLASPATTSAASAVTFHGTFDTGIAYSVPGGTPLFGLPLTGDWNVNINLAGDAPRAKAQFVVRFVPADAELGFPAHGLDALWTPSFLDLTPLTAPSSAAGIITDAAGAVYDPEHAVYAFGADMPGATVVAVINTKAGSFFYGAVPHCTPGDPDLRCYMSVEVKGTIGR